jgi:hypothetical protein
MKSLLLRIKLFFATLKKRRELKEEDPYIYK